MNSINNTNTFNSFRSNTQNNMERNSQRLASGNRINSGRDDAAGLAIANLTEAEIRALNQGSRNALDMDSALRTADGSLNGVTDNLQRVRELSLQASGSLLSNSQRQSIQNEINQVLDQVGQTVGSADFNGMNLLDGSFEDMNIQVSANSTIDTNISDSGLAALGLAGGINVMGGTPDIAAIDSALQQVSSNRGNIGAQQNIIDFAVQSNNINAVNTAQSRSRINDADMALEVMRMRQAQVMEQYDIFSVRNQMERNRQNLGFLGVSF
jgi:flagellin